jgi:iron complex transport system substrate-binding protein
VIPDPRANRWWRGIAVLAVLAVAILACRNSSDDAAKGPRIISIGGSVTEIAFALGAGDQIIAVDTSSVFPESARALPKVGYQRTLAAEGILSLQPTLILAADEAGPPSTIEQLTSAGVPVQRFPNAIDLPSTLARIQLVGAALHRDKEAAALAAKVSAEANAALAKVPPTGPSFVVMFGHGGGSMMAAGTNTSGAAMVALAGGHNAVSSFAGYKAVSAEALVAAAPDVIVVPEFTLKMSGGIDGVLALPGVAETPAGRNRRIVAFDDLLLLGFGPRLGTGIEELSRALHSAPAT